MYLYSFNNSINYNDPEGEQAAEVLTTGWTAAAIEPTVIGEAVMIVVTIGIVIELGYTYAKGRQNIRDTELQNLSDEEIYRGARDKTKCGKDRNRFRREEKARKQTRNQQKRKEMDKNVGKNNKGKNK